MNISSMRPMSIIFSLFFFFWGELSHIINVQFAGKRSMHIQDKDIYIYIHINYKDCDDLDEKNESTVHF